MARHNPGEILFTTAGPNIRPNTRKSATKRTNGTRKDVLSEDARKSGYYVATYSPGDGKTRYRFFDLAEMARKGVSPQEQTYFGPLNGVHTALGLAAAKKFLNAPAKRTNGSRSYYNIVLQDAAGSVLTPPGEYYVSSMAQARQIASELAKNYGQRAFIYPANSHGRATSDVPVAVVSPRRKNAVKAPAKRTNGAKSVADPVAARELELYIENEYALVGAANSIGKAVMKNLAQKMARGTYDATKAWKGWMYLVDEGAKRYNREFGTKFGTGAFNKATREMVAVRLAEVFESEVKSGTINVSELIGKANPQSKTQKAALARLKRIVELVALQYNNLFFVAPRTHEERKVWLRLQAAKKEVAAHGLDVAHYVDKYRY